MRINFIGWVVADSENNLLNVIRAPMSVSCDSCGRVARYGMIDPSDGVSSAYPSCHDCLLRSFEDPASPDRFYAPVKKDRVVTYSNGDCQAILNL